MTVPEAIAFICNYSEANVEDLIDSLEYLFEPYEETDEYYTKKEEIRNTLGAAIQSIRYANELAQK